MAGLTVANANNSAYTRAEKMLHLPNSNSVNIENNNLHGSANANRDPYSGFSRIFIMPNVGNTNSEY